MAASGLAESLLEQADLDGAEAAIATVGPAVNGGSLFAAVLRHVRGRVLLARRRPEEALGDFLAAGAVLQGCRAVTPAIVPWRAEAALAQLALGDTGARSGSRAGSSPSPARSVRRGRSASRCGPAAP